MKRHGKKGFTLIELLVVIAVIALLIAVVLPALSKAKRHAQNIICCNNLANIAKGLAIQSLNNDNKFIDRVPSNGSIPPAVPSIVYRKGTDPEAIKETYLNDVVMDNEDALFCPLLEKGSFFAKPGIDPSVTTVTERMRQDSKYFFIHQGATLNYYGSYNIFAGIPDEGTWRFDYSGNSSRKKPPAMGSMDCLAADLQQTWYVTYAGGDLPVPVRSNHSREFSVEPENDFIDSNAVFGDMHVERRKELKNCVYRITGNPVVMQY